MKKLNTKINDVQEWVRQAQAGSEEAKERLCEQFRGLIYSLSKTSYETLEAEDMRQMLWLHFLECLQDYDEKQGVAFASYIITRMRWRAKNLCRTHRSKVKHEVPACSNETMEGIVAGDIPVNSGNPNWYEVEAMACGKRTVHGLVEELPLTGRQREMLSLRLLGNSWGEVASQMHISLSMVYRYARQIQGMISSQPEILEKFLA